MPRRKTRSIRPIGLGSPSKLIIIGVLLLAAIGGIAWTRHHKSSNQANAGQAAPSAGTSKVNLQPPTTQDKQETQNHKDQLAQTPPAAPTDSSTGKKIVSPIITHADKYGTNAYVTGVFEDGGTCTATYTKDSQNITATSQGSENSNYTSCGPMKLPGPLNINGTWTVVVSYSSTDAQGKSAPQQVEVP